MGWVYHRWAGYISEAECMQTGLYFSHNLLPKPKPQTEILDVSAFSVFNYVSTELIH